MKQDDIATMPVTAWELKSVPAMGALMIQLSYLSHSMQSLQDAHRSPHYVLTLAQARELAQRTLAMCERAESSTPPSSPDQRH